MQKPDDSPKPIIGIAHCLLPALTMGRASPSKSFLCTANYLMRGVEILAKEPVQARHACAFLAAQTLESILKSYLAHKGCTEKRLKKEYGHDLEKLWKGASQKGLNISESPSDWCATLNSGHKPPFYFRYMGELNMFVFSNFTEIESSLKNLIVLVDTEITRLRSLPTEMI